MKTDTTPGNLENKKDEKKEETQGKTQEKSSEKDKDKDKTFNKLKEIQALLKKESSLNDLCT